MSLPICHCPPGVAKPDWCPLDGPFGVMADQGGGACWNGVYRPGNWQEHPKGWRVLLDGHQPQHLVRSRPHPRIIRSVAVVGATPEQLWLVPVLIRPVLQTETAKLFEPALDRVWRDGAWQMPVDMDHLIAGLLDLASDSPPAGTVDDRNAALAKLTIGILALTHHLDIELMSLTGWLTETVQSRVLAAASGISEGVPC